MEKDIIYSPHLEFRLKLRGISSLLPRRIFQDSRERYFDNETELRVAVGQAKYRGKVRGFAVVYKEREDDVLLITIHPLKARQKESRVRAGRWRKI